MMAFKPFEEYPVFLYRMFYRGFLEFMGARYELDAQACEVQETPWAQLSQCDTVEQPIAIHMSWFTGWRNYFYNASSRFRPIEGIPREEPPRVAELAHVDQRAPLAFGGCGRLSRNLADRLPNLFDSDLAPMFDTVNRRPFNHGPPFAPRSRTMQDQAAGSAVGWNATQSHAVSAEQRVLQPGAGGNVGAVVRYATDMLLQQAAFAPGGGDTAELANTLKAAVENLGGVEAMMLQTTRLHTRPAKRTPEGHKHAKWVLLPEDSRS
jgi:hypothetical protein